MDEPCPPAAHPLDPLLGRIHCCDNMELLRRLPDESCDLITIDPPFFTGKNRRGSGPGTGYDDRFCGSRDSYMAFMAPRLVEMHRVLAGHGTLYVHLDYRTVHYVKVFLDELFREDNFLNEIIWSYRTGGVSRRRLARKHDTILAYAKSFGSHTFHRLRDGRYRTLGMRHDEAGRPFKSTRRGPLFFDAGGPALTDVWDIPFLSTVSAERTGYPTQKPLALLKRIVSISSDPGQIVADLFCGSGTSLVAAKMLKRRWLGCDSSTEAVRISRDRLAVGGLTPPSRRGRRSPPREVHADGLFPL